MNLRGDRAIKWWLASGCFLIFLMVIVGGITRLTGSGLSITEWKVVTGTLPPMNDQQWQEEFDKYKQIPQYQQLNSYFELSDFKKIYFWEYIHRLIGRMIGFVFLIPFIYFYVKKRISKQLLPRLLGMFMLGALQGFIGWYMVSSGLSENIRVSHLRLALHLGTAFITFGYIFYVLLLEIYPQDTIKQPDVTHKQFFPVILLTLIFLQIIIGAFVAGTHAGFIYNTWPKMEGQWLPDAVPYAWANDGLSSIINNIVTIQFIHRNLAYLIVILSIVWWYLQKRNYPAFDKRVRASNMLMMVIILQAGLGIFTLLARVPVWMGVLHQAMAFVLFASDIYLTFISRYKTA